MDAAFFTPPPLDYYLPARSGRARIECPLDVRVPCVARRCKCSHAHGSHLASAWPTDRGGRPARLLNKERKEFGTISSSLEPEHKRLQLATIERAKVKKKKKKLPSKKCRGLTSVAVWKSGANWNLGSTESTFSFSFHFSSSSSRRSRSKLKKSHNDD